MVIQKKFLLRIILTYFIWSISSLRGQLYANTILNCLGDIPNKTSCLIKATSYKINVERIDICQNNPFPSNRKTPDYINSNCVNLYDIRKDSIKFALKRNSKFELPNIDNVINKEGNYNFLSMIFRNQFTVSGEYTVGDKTFKTGSKGPRNIIVGKKNSFKPQEIDEKLTNWRGIEDKDNKYCENGGTSSRCELNYNSFRLTAIGLNANFEETFGDQTKYLFYSSRFKSPIKIKKNTKGYFDISYQKNLEVYGNGKVIKSISTAPFLFKAAFYEN